jgi:hypothetical protein
MPHYLATVNASASDAFRPLLLPTLATRNHHSVTRRARRCSSAICHIVAQDGEDCVVRHLRCSFQIREDRVDASRPAQDEAVSTGRLPISSFTPQRQSAPLWALCEGVSADGSGPTRTRERIELLHACPRQNQGSDGEDDARRWHSSAGCFRCV